MPEHEGWAKETFSLPPAFAPGMTWKGAEELRFAPGWMKADAETFFSYALLFWLPDDQKVDAATSERELLSYYRGLAGAVLGARKRGGGRRHLYPDGQGRPGQARQPARRRAGQGLRRRVEMDRAVRHRQASGVAHG